MIIYIIISNLNLNIYINKKNFKLINNISIIIKLYLSD